MTSDKAAKLTIRKLVLFSGIAILIVLVVGEIILRFAGYAPVETCYVNVPGIHHIHKANWRGELDGKVLITNSWGLRGDDFPRKKPNGEFRILCLGDSVTFGFNLDMGEDYPAQLEKRLNMRDGGKRIYRAINAAADAYSKREEVEYYIRYGASFSPDRVIIGICLNDVTEKNLPLDLPFKNFLKKSAYFYLFKDIRHRLVVSDIKDRNNQIYGLRDDFSQKTASAETEKSWDLVFSELRRLKAAIGPRASTDLRVLLFPTATMLSEPGSGAADRVAGFCEHEGIAFGDPLPILKNCKGKMFLDEIHLTAGGTACVAEWLAGHYPSRIESPWKSVNLCL